MKGQNSGQMYLTVLQNQGLKDIFIACVDSLKGFPNAINAVYPQCIWCVIVWNLFLGKITKRWQWPWSWFTKHQLKHKHEKIWPHFRKNDNLLPEAGKRIGQISPHFLITRPTSAKRFIPQMRWNHSIAWFDEWLKSATCSQRTIRYSKWYGLRWKMHQRNG